MIKLEERLRARDYKDPQEQEAFRQGYADGFAGRRMNEAYERQYPNAYAAGYWEGTGEASRE